MKKIVGCVLVAVPVLTLMCMMAYQMILEIKVRGFFHSVSFVFILAIVFFIMILLGEYLIKESRGEG